MIKKIVQTRSREIESLPQDSIPAYYNQNNAYKGSFICYLRLRYDTRNYNVNYVKRKIERQQKSLPVI